MINYLNQTLLILMISAIGLSNGSKFLKNLLFTAK